MRHETILTYAVAALQALSLWVLNSLDGRIGRIETRLMNQAAIMGLRTK